MEGLNTTNIWQMCCQQSVFVLFSFFQNYIYSTQRYAMLIMQIIMSFILRWQELWNALKTSDAVSMSFC